MQIEGIGIGIIWYVLLLSFLLKLRHEYSSSSIIGLFTLKVIGTFALQWIFTYYYTDRTTADIYRFFDDGIILNQVFYSNPIDYFKILFNAYSDSDGFRSMYFEQMNAWIKPFDSGFYNDNHFMIKMNSLMAFLSFGYYEVHGLIFSFLAFIGIMWSVEYLLDSIRDKEIALFLAVLFPSSLLWVSGGLKEAVLIFGIGAFFKAISNERLSIYSRAFVGLVSAITLISVKIYFFAALIPAFITHLVTKKNRLNQAYSILIWSCFIILALVVTRLYGFHLEEYLIRKQHDFINHTQVISPGSAFDLTYLESGYISILKSSPEALMNALFRPFPQEVNSIPEILMLLENIIIAALLVISIIQYATVTPKPKIKMWILLLIIPTLILTGLVTPVFGAIMRYRAPSLIILVIILTPLLNSFRERFLKFKL